MDLTKLAVVWIISFCVLFLIFVFFFEQARKAGTVPQPTAQVVPQQPVSAPTYRCPKHGKVGEVLIFSFEDEPPLAFCLRCLRDGLRTVVPPIGFEPKEEKVEK